MIYFVASMNNNPIYKNIWNLNKCILRLFKFNYIEVNVEIDNPTDELYETVQKNKIWQLRCSKYEYPLTSYFDVSIARWLAYMTLNSDDIMIITDGDLLTIHPDKFYEIINAYEDKLREGYILCTSSYEDRKCHYDATYQIGKASSFRQVFQGCFNLSDMIKLAENNCKNTKIDKYYDEHFVSEQLRKYGRVIDLKARESWLSLYNFYEFNKDTNLDFDNIFEIHSYKNNYEDTVTLNSIAYQLNEYYKSKGIVTNGQFILPNEWYKFNLIF